MSDPEQIQRQIDDTRESLREDIEAVEEKVSPSRVVGRRIEQIKVYIGSRMERIKGTVASAKNRLMGSKDTESTAPETAGGQVQGSRLVVGLVAFGAFGAGYLLSAVLARRRNRRRTLTWRWPVTYASR